LYEDFVEHTSTIGSYDFSNGREAKTLRLYERFNEIADDFFLTTEELGRPIVSVPSPWHAVFHLRRENKRNICGYSNLVNFNPFVFRGQRDSRWPIQASINRTGVDRELETTAANVFAELLRRIYIFQHFTDIISPSLLAFSEIDPIIPADVHLATAQHYGIKTELVDFTTDPSVAVWFACQAAPGEKAELAAVFATPIHTRTDKTLLFPHPYVRRLYRQRGLFIRQGHDETGKLEVGDPLRQQSLEIRFAPDSSFELKRDKLGFRPKLPDLHKVDWDSPAWTDDSTLLPEDAWWNDMVTKSYEIARDGRLEELLKSADKMPMTDLQMDTWNFIGDLVLPQEFMRVDHKSHAVQESTHALVQMLLSLTIGAVRNIDSRAVIFPQSLKAVAKDSAPVLAAMWPLMNSFVQSRHPKNAFRMFAAAMLEALKESILEYWPGYNFDMWRDTIFPGPHDGRGPSLKSRLLKLIEPLIPGAE
jgi:hypothetical protein